MGIRIDGKAIAKKYRMEIKKLVQDKKENNLKLPCIATILVGNDGGSIHYVKNQNKLCSELGVITKDIFFDESITENELIDTIDNLNKDTEIDGIMLQVPLPSHIDERKVTSQISYKKDIDGLTDINAGRLYRGGRCFVPCTPKGIIELIKSTGINISGKNAVIVGRSNIVGKPTAQLLLNENATVTICHSKTANIKEVCSSADILVCAIGKPGFITSEFVKEGAVVIDVGTTMVDGKLTGDVCFDEVINKAAFVTPVPGGVGAMTTAMLIKNVCEAADNVY